MKTKAAIAVKAGEDLVIEELDLDGPGDMKTETSNWCVTQCIYIIWR